MNKFSIKTRLAALVGVMVVLLLWLASANVLRMQNANTVVKTLYQDRVVALKQLKDVSDAFALTISGVSRRVAEGSLPGDDAAKAVKEAVARAQKEWKDYSVTSMDAHEKALADKTAPMLAQASTLALKLADLVEAAEAGEVSAFSDKELRPAVEPLLAATHQLVQVQLTVAQELFEASQHTYDSVFTRTLVLSSVLLVAVVAFAWALVRSIVQPLNRAVEVAETVATGDLTVAIEVKGKDETAQLMGALHKMTTNLADIVSQVRASSDSIATGSSQIAAGNADLSQRTEEQASNLQQTAASMEELTATVKQNADTARSASQLASKASSAAAHGGDVVGKVVATMTQIADSSKKVQSIISVIDGIAFQTNILALNAAVEAARAGEQGRGFAVVAAEVRSLAQRSAAAAKEVSALIGTSVENVASGTALVGQAGQAMGGIVLEVQRVNDLISEITAASQEQSQGISQVGDAVNQLDQVTQQNAALVEESAAAAESLKQQALRLTEVVGAFRVLQSTASLAPAGGALGAATAVSGLEPGRRAPTPSVSASPKAVLAPTVAAPAKALATPSPSSVARAAIKSSSPSDEGDWETF